MYKLIFKLVLELISRPSKTWKSLAAERERGIQEGRNKEQHERFLSNYVYPFIGLMTVAAFISICTRQEFDFEYALKSAILTLVSFFGGFYLASYVLGEVWRGLFKQPKDVRLCQSFVGLASSLMYVLEIVRLLLPDFFFLYVFVLYTFYIVWEGSIIYMKVDEAVRMKFTTLASLILILTPMAINYLFVILMPAFH